LDRAQELSQNERHGRLDAIKARKRAAAARDNVVAGSVRFDLEVHLATPFAAAAITDRYVSRAVAISGSVSLLI
jgi:hypothetical protein